MEQYYSQLLGRVLNQVHELGLGIILVGSRIIKLNFSFLTKTINKKSRSIFINIKTFITVSCFNWYNRFLCKRCMHYYLHSYIYNRGYPSASITCHPPPQDIARPTASSSSLLQPPPSPSKRIVLKRGP